MPTPYSALKTQKPKKYKPLCLICFWLELVEVWKPRTAPLPDGLEISHLAVAVQKRIAVCNELAVQPICPKPNHEPAQQLLAKI